MSKINDGGPAFPRVGEGFGNPEHDAPGMSLRDWFAGQALVGMLSHPGCEVMGSYHNNCDEKGVASVAYAYADAMLAEREKGGDA